MNYIYEGMVRRAYLLVELVMDKYKKGAKIAFFPILAGIGSCSIEYRGRGHNSYAVVDAINEYYTNTDDKDVIKGYEEGILTMIRMAKNLGTLQETLDIIYYQCRIEKEEKASFHINRKKILDYFDETIKNNYGQFMTIPGFQDWYDKQKELILLFVRGESI